jgi:hypothetical protein
MPLTLTRKKKLGLALIPFALILLFVGYEALRVWWYRGYSRGSRTGIILKVTEKGPPYCKYLEAEMKVGGNATLAPESWHFSVDDDSPTSAVVVALKAAEKKQASVTVEYRQDLHALFRCSETEYFVTKVEN